MLERFKFRTYRRTNLPSDVFHNLLVIYLQIHTYVLKLSFAQRCFSQFVDDIFVNTNTFLICLEMCAEFLDYMFVFV